MVHGYKRSRVLTRTYGTYMYWSCIITIYVSWDSLLISLTLVQLKCTECTVATDVRLGSHIGRLMVLVIRACMYVNTIGIDIPEQLRAETLLSRHFCSVHVITILRIGRSKVQNPGRELTRVVGRVSTRIECAITQSVLPVRMRVCGNVHPIPCIL